MSKHGRKITELLCSIRGGDENAWRELFHQTFKHLKDVAYQYAIDKNDCEDVVLEAYEKVHKYVNTFDPEQDGYNWLCRIVQNVAFDHNKRILSRPTVLLEEGAQAFSVDDFYNVLENHELRAKLLTLSEEEQTVIYYRYWEGRSYEEIAKLMGKAKSMIFYIDRRSAKKLKKNYE